MTEDNILRNKYPDQILSWSGKKLIKVLIGQRTPKWLFQWMTFRAIPGKAFTITT
jgi:hypothetical protein